MPYDLNIPGWLTVDELTVIEKLATQVPKSGVIVEIGSLMGRSSYCWATSCDPSVKVYCVDIFYEHYKVNHQVPKEICDKNNFPLSDHVYNTRLEFQNHTRHLSNVIQITGHSPDISLPGDPLDLLFLDASHSNPNDWDNIEFFLPMIKPNGIISGHDCDLPDVRHNISRLETMLHKSVTKYAGTSLWSFVLPSQSTL